MHTESVQCAEARVHVDTDIVPSADITDASRNAVLGHSDDRDALLLARARVAILICKNGSTWKAMRCRKFAERARGALNRQFGGGVASKPNMPVAATSGHIHSTYIYRQVVDNCVYKCVDTGVKACVDTRVDTLFIHCHEQYIKLCIRRLTPTVHSTVDACCTIYIYICA